MAWGKKKRNLLNHATRINHYFANAVSVYWRTGEDDSRIAALTAAKVAARKQRKTMVSFLETLASGMKQAKSDVAFDEPMYAASDKVFDNLMSEAIASKILSLKEEIELKDWTIMDIAEEKDRLATINPEYLSALNKADPDVFVNKYPELFQDKK